MLTRSSPDSGQLGLPSPQSRQHGACSIATVSVATTSGSYLAVRVCLELGADVNAVNYRHETALHGAAFRGVNQIVDYLVDEGARLDTTTVEGWTPLALANGLSYSDFYKAQRHTANRLRELMRRHGLDTEGYRIEPSVCLDCFQTRPDQVRAAIERDRRMEAEFISGPRAGREP